MVYNLYRFLGQERVCSRDLAARGRHNGEGRLHPNSRLNRPAPSERQKRHPIGRARPTSSGELAGKFLREWPLGIINWAPLVVGRHVCSGSFTSIPRCPGCGRLPPTAAMMLQCRKRRDVPQAAIRGLGADAGDRSLTRVCSRLLLVCHRASGD